MEINSVCLLRIIYNSGEAVIFEDTRITRDIEKRSVNFKLLEKEIPNYNKRREDRRNRRLQ